MPAIPKQIRRRLRLRLGSRTQRRAGIKSHGNPKPRWLLSQAIKAWHAAGCPEVPPRA